MRVEQDISIRGRGKYVVSVDTVTGAIVLMVPGKFGRSQGHTHIVLPKLVVSAVRDLLALSDLAPNVEELQLLMTSAMKCCKEDYAVRPPDAGDDIMEADQPLLFGFDPLPNSGGASALPGAPDRHESHPDPDGLDHYSDRIVGGILD